MPRVRFIGTAVSYTTGKYRFTQDRAVLEVEEETWKYLKKQRSKANHRLFMLAADDDDDDEISQAETLPGCFPTKKAALDYARDLLGVELAESISLEQLNAQTYELKRRYDQGMRGDNLIAHMRLAALTEEAAAEAAAREAEVALETSGDIDTAKEHLSRRVAKPGKVREIGASA